MDRFPAFPTASGTKSLLFLAGRVTIATTLTTALENALPAWKSGYSRRQHTALGAVISLRVPILLDDLNGGDQKTVITSYGGARPSSIHRQPGPSYQEWKRDTDFRPAYPWKGRTYPGSGIEIAVTVQRGDRQSGNCGSQGFHDHGLLIQQPVGIRT